MPLDNDGGLLGTPAHDAQQIVEIPRMAPPVAAGITQGIIPFRVNYTGIRGTNRTRFECGVDLKALLKIDRKELLKGLWSTDGSSAIAYVSYNAVP